MAIPEKIPIQRIEDYHTHHIGMTKDGRQFFGYETFIFPDGIPKGDWMKARREYVVLYIFDKDGNYIETKHCFVGFTADISPSNTSEKLDEMIAELGEIEYKDILVKPFQTEIDGFVFGLVPNIDEEEGFESVDLEPSSTISFHEPWDGEYDT